MAANQIVVDSMSMEEVFDLFRKDLPLLNHKIEESNKRIQKKATTFRNTERIYYRPITFTSSRGFSYVIQYFNRGIQFEQRNRIGCYYYVKYLHKGGIHMFMPSLANKEVMHFNFFIPHFFDRYRERKLKDLSLSKDEVIDTYIRNNAKRALKFVPSLKYPQCSYCQSDEGLALCELKDHDLIFLYKTFIPWEDLGPAKKQIALDGLEAVIKSGFELNLPEDIFDGV